MTQEQTPATPYDAKIAALEDGPDSLRWSTENRRTGYLRALEDAQPYREAVQALVEAATIVEQFSNEHPFTGIGNARTHTGYGMMHVDLIDALAGIRKIQEGA